MKRFYRQTKKRSGVAKPVASSKKRRSGKAAETLLAVAVNDDECGEEERLLQFDMDMRYGPCIGLTRLQRWQRAAAMGLHPPPDVGALLHDKPSVECLWDARL